ncbi:hypothetical protein GCM10009092_39740 [Bowmanella denitrificans]|uniref:HTH araC/xylS-type domain-containing protein n=1 Tax=Bowmanella denitrificans TaxID=366582 RepID=A0ABP3HIW2_9ALTE
MKNIAVLVTDNAVGSHLMGVRDFFDYANTLWRYLHPNDDNVLFDTRIYSADGSQIQCSNGFLLPARPIQEIDKADVLLAVPAFTYDKTGLTDYLYQAQPMFELLAQASAEGALVASHCSGTFAMAEAGILNGRQATTCWWLKEVFASRYPQVELRMDELVVSDEHLLTGGATTSLTSLCLAILERLYGYQLATNLSKVLLLDRHRLSQQAFIDPHFVIGHRDSLIEKIQHWMQQNYAQTIGLDDICDQFAVTKRTLIRRFKAACGETPLVYLQQIRVEKAKQLLEGTDMPVERIVEMVGYGDPASFRKLFSTLTQLTPKAYRQRFSYRQTA